MEYADIAEIVNPEYQKGFNEGYLIADHEPDLAEGLISTSGESIYLAGLKDGIEQINLEKEKLLTASWLQRKTEPELGRDEKQLDKDDLDKG